MELMLLKPKLVITLGAVAFGVFCPKLTMSNSFGKIHKSDRFGVRVFPIYHPSPRNLDIDERRQQFDKDISLICRLILAHKKKHSKA
jgi:uracil-DNA glycosylase